MTRTPSGLPQSRERPTSGYWPMTVRWWESTKPNFSTMRSSAVCNDLANKGVRVVVAGLDMDFKGNPFGPMPALMATAEYVTKVHAICTRTGNLANYSFRKSNNDDLVLLGETEEYEPLSRAAYYKAMLREKINKMEVEAEDIPALRQGKNKAVNTGK